MSNSDVRRFVLCWSDASPFSASRDSSRRDIRPACTELLRVALPLGRKVAGLSSMRARASANDIRSCLLLRARADSPKFSAQALGIKRRNVWTSMALATRPRGLPCDPSLRVMLRMQLEFLARAMFTGTTVSLRRTPKILWSSSVRQSRVGFSLLGHLYST